MSKGAYQVVSRLLEHNHGLIVDVVNNLIDGYEGVHLLGELCVLQKVNVPPNSLQQLLLLLIQHTHAISEESQVLIIVFRSLKKGLRHLWH